MHLVPVTARPDKCLAPVMTVEHKVLVPMEALVNLAPMEALMNLAPMEALMNLALMRALVNTAPKGALVEESSFRRESHPCSNRVLLFRPHFGIPPWVPF